MKLSTLTLALTLALSATSSQAFFATADRFMRGNLPSQNLDKSKRPANGFSSGTTKKQKGFGGQNSGRNFKRSKHKGFSR